jgi:hypothetical protein
LGPGLATTAHGFTDFVALYTGAKLSFTHDQYNAARVLATELRATGYASESRLFVRLPAYGLVLWPIAQLPYSFAWWSWESLSSAALAAFVSFWPFHRKATLVACCCSLPLWMALAEGQDLSLVLLCVALAVLSFKQGRLAWAGVFLSLCAAKYHLFLLLPLWMISNRLWRVAVGFAAGLVLVLTLSFVAAGPRWPLQYARLLRQPYANPYPELMPNLHGQFQTLVMFEFLGAVAIACIVWFAIRNLPAALGLAPVLIGGVLIAPHAYMADCALFVPAVLMLLSKDQKPLTKALCLLLLTPVPYAALMLHEGVCVIVPAVALLLTLAHSEPVRVRAKRPQSAQCPSIAVDSQA